MCGQTVAITNPRLRPLPLHFIGWGQDTTQRIYEGIGVKGTTVPKSLSGDFKVDGYNIRVTKPSKGARKARVFLRVGEGKKARLVPVGRVRQANLTHEEYLASRA
jgi:hypothetical protein